MYTYLLYAYADEDVFYEKCKMLENCIQGLIKGRKLRDVDCSLVQMYYLNGKTIVVFNNWFTDSIFIRSEVDLQSYFTDMNCGN